MTEALPAIGDCSSDSAATLFHPEPAVIGPITATLIQDSIAASTRKAYRGALGRLDAWLDGRVLDDHALSEWIAVLHGRGLSSSSASLAVAACRFRAKMSGLENPAGPMTARTLVGIRRNSENRGRGQVAGVTWEEADLVVDRAMEEGTVRALRDAALIAVGSDALLRVGEMVAINACDIERYPDGSAVLHIRRSKTDQEGMGATCYLGPRTVEVLDRWMGVAGIGQDGNRPDDPVFRSVRKGGDVGGRLSCRSARAIVIRRCGRGNGGHGGIGRISGHSLRVGSAMSLARAGASLVELQQAGRWKSPEMPARYTRGESARRGPVARLRHGQVGERRREAGDCPGAGGISGRPRADTTQDIEQEPGPDDGLTPGIRFNGARVGNSAVPIEACEQARPCSPASSPGIGEPASGGLIGTYKQEGPMSNRRPGRGERGIFPFRHACLPWGLGAPLVPLDRMNRTNVRKRTMKQKPDEPNSFGMTEKIRAILATVFLSLVLTACGGGGGNGMDSGGGGNTGDGNAGDGDMPHPVPTLADIYSSATAADHSFDTISASVLRNYTTNTTSVPDTNELAVSSIRRNAGGGYDITYHIDETMRTVQFRPEHCDEVEEYCEQSIGEGDETIRHEFWSVFTPVEGGGQLDLTTDMDYFSVAELWTRRKTSEDQDVNLVQRFVFGVETPAASVPSRGEAIYRGWFYADAYRHGSSSSSYRQRFDGSMRIVANFDMSSLDGELFSVRGGQPGQRASSDRVPWPTSSFRITGGRINSEGQFTATLTGMDSDPSVPDNESVRGFMGEVVGRLFGPGAEELGGLVSASRDLDGDDNDLNLYGFVAAPRLGPSRTLGAAAMTSGNLRKYAADTTELLVDDGMATVERIEGGWRVHVDGRTVVLRDREDYGSAFNGFYTRDVEDGRAWFWSDTDGLFAGAAEFDHFDVKGWGFPERENPGDDTETEANRFLVHGNRTPTSAMPASGTADYEGRLRAVEVSTDRALASHGSSATWFDGTVNLGVDFGASTVTGSFTGLERRTGSSGTPASATGGATFNATISAGGFTAGDLTGTGVLTGYSGGNVGGAFFGPSAEEAAGVFSAANPSANRILNGWFGTDRQDQ